MSRLLKLKPETPYMFIWRDHFSTEGIFYKEDLDLAEEIVFKSLGFFIKEDRHYYHFARSITTDGEQYADFMSVLKGHVLEVTPV